MTERRQIFYAGNVQGVGFRATIEGIARSFEVTGFVRNLPDGRVEVLAEGASKELDAFLGEISEQRADFIRSVKCDNRPSTGEFVGFRVCY